MENFRKISPCIDVIEAIYKSETLIITRQPAQYVKDVSLFYNPDCLVIICEYRCITDRVPIGGIPQTLSFNNLPTETKEYINFKTFFYFFCEYGNMLRGSLLMPEVLWFAQRH